MEGVQLGIAPEHPSFRYDQPVVLRIAIKNVREEEIYVRTGLYFSMYRFDVRLPNGKPAPLTLEGARLKNIAENYGSGGLDKLESGATFDSGMMLDRYYDMTLIGEYTVTIYHIRSYDKAAQKWVEVPSNTAKVIVRHHTAEELEEREQQETNE